MIQIKHESYWNARRAGVVAVALVLGVLIIGGYAMALPRSGGALPAAPNKDKTQELTQVFDHTYDEVFQASLEAIERSGLFASAKDKEKGTISGSGNYPFTGNGGTGYVEITFDIHIEIISTKPETRITVNAKAKGFGGSSFAKRFNPLFLGDVQKVLSTYH